MSTYVIGDVQGCYYSLMQLLEKIHFQPEEDKLWFVGDVINRGSGSLAVLRWLYAHQAHVQIVLGNHDLHTLVVAEGHAQAHRSDTIVDILAAPDRDELLRWLRHQPLLHYQHDVLMVHAGLLPQWGVQEALNLASEVESALQGKHYQTFLAHMYGNKPKAWDDDLQGWDRLRVITNAMTRLRVCNAHGEMDFKFKGTLHNLPHYLHDGAPLMPWFSVPNRQSANTLIVFGHWSALGLSHQHNTYALDTGCLWNGALTALRLEDKAIFQVPCSEEDGAIAIDFAD